MRAQTGPDGGFLTSGRIGIYLRLLAVGNLLGIGFAICRAHGFFLPQEPHFTTEFTSFYAAGRLADIGQAAPVYAPGAPLSSFIPSGDLPPAHLAMQQAITHDPQIIPFGFFYPPVFLLLCAPLAFLPYLPAFLLWVGATGGLLAAVLRRLLGGWGKIWPALAYLAVIENAGVGENAFLSAGLLGAGLLSVETRPLIAGLCFGALCYKPHFMLPVGLFLLAGGHFRAIFTAGVSALGLCGASVLLFGAEPWADYLRVTIPHASYMFAHAGVAYNLQVTPVSAMRELHLPALLPELVELGFTLFAAWMIITARHAALNVRAACLAACFPLISPVMLNYDLTISGLAMPFLLREMAAGERPYERLAMALMFISPLMLMLLRTDFGVPIDWLVPVFFLLVLRARFNPGATSTAPPRTPLPAGSAPSP